jgi:hypothetical protein
MNILLKIPNSLCQTVRVIVKKAESTVTVPAQKPPHFVSPMIVIHAQTIPRIVATTNGTTATLLHSQIVVLS